MCDYVGVCSNEKESCGNKPKQWYPQCFKKISQKIKESRTEMKFRSWTMSDKCECDGLGELDLTEALEISKRIN